MKSEPILKSLQAESDCGYKTMELSIMIFLQCLSLFVCLFIS